jgi:hypothetical protein
MTTVLGFVDDDTLDDALGAGGTLELMRALARHAPGGRLCVRRTGGGYLAVQADGSAREATFEQEDPHEEFEPTVREVGFVAWPSDEAPQLPFLIVPGWDASWDLAAVRADPTVARMTEAESLLGTLGCTDDALVWLAAPVYDANDTPRERPQRAAAEDLLQVAMFLGLVMRYG